MGGFGIWHWVVLLGFGLVVAGGVALLAWVIMKAVNRPGARHKPPSSD